MNEVEAIALALGSFIAGGATVYTGLIAYAKNVGHSKGSGWRPLKVGRLEQTSEAVVVTYRDVPPLSLGTPQVKHPGPIISGSSDNMPRAQEAYRFRLANDNGTTAEILLSARYIARFVQMEDLARANWTGKATIYGDLLRVAQSRRWIEAHELRQNAWQWVRGMSTLGRRVERLQAEKIPLPFPQT